MVMWVAPDTCDQRHHCYRSRVKLQTAKTAEAEGFCSRGRADRHLEETERKGGKEDPCAMKGQTAWF